MPAAAVTPTLKVYVKVVAVKTLVVGFRASAGATWGGAVFAEPWGFVPSVILFVGRRFPSCFVGGASPPRGVEPGAGPIVTLNKIWCSRHV